MAGTASKDKVAMVNGTVITRSEYDKELGRFERQMAMSGKAPKPTDVSEMKGRVLDGLIDRELLKQDSKKLGIAVDDNEVNQQLAALKQKFGNREGVYRYAGQDESHRGRIEGAIAAGPGSSRS